MNSVLSHSQHKLPNIGMNRPTGVQHGNTHVLIMIYNITISGCLIRFSADHWSATRTPCNVCNSNEPVTSWCPAAVISRSGSGREPPVSRSASIMSAYKLSSRHTKLLSKDRTLRKLLHIIIYLFIIIARIGLL